ncbi:MAG: ATP-binding protein, partial [Planctomycetota bacterium]
LQKMVDDLVSAGAEDQDSPAANRNWVRLSSMIDAVNGALQGRRISRGIGVVWEGQQHQHRAVFADEIKFQRLLTNLIDNAISITRAGDDVVVQIHVIDGGGALRLSVTDQGRGMDRQALQRSVEDQASGRGSSGLGLGITRQMAGLHHSLLCIATQPGMGTETSIEIPAGGPLSVARQYCRWRDAIRRMLGGDGFAGRLNLHRRSEDGSNPVGNTIDAAGRETTRIDRPVSSVDGPQRDIPLSADSASSSSADNTLAGADQVPGGVIVPDPFRTGRLCLLTGHPTILENPPVWADGVISFQLLLPDSLSMSDCDSVDQFLLRHSGIYDLVYRMGRRSWILLCDAAAHQIDDQVSAVKRGVQTHLRDHGESDSHAEIQILSPVALPLGKPGDHVRITDRFVRRSLEQAIEPASAGDPNHRAGGKPRLTTSIIAEDRLEEELHRLAVRMRDSSKRMRQQIQELE